MLDEPQATIELDWENGLGSVQRQTLTIKPEAAKTNIAASQWARLRIAELSAEYDVNRSEIRRVGTAFGMVTRDTSLIVLDRVEDYVRYEVTPPVDMLPEYTAGLAQSRQQLVKDQATHLEGLVQRFEARIRWWEKDFPKGDMPQRAHDKRKIGAAGLGAVQREEPAEAEPEMAAPPPSPAPASAPMLEMRAMAKMASPVASKPALPSAPAMIIQLKKWSPDTPYTQRLRAAAAGDLYKIYLDERRDYLNSTAFFLDAADILFERGQPALALRVLSNLAEMDLENRHILRILGYRLLQAKQPALAIPILMRVLQLGPNEPQSYRDLGLAYAQDGQPQKAVDLLYQVVTRPWSDRFADIDLIALGEMNAVIARSPARVDTTHVDARLLRNLPLDVRAVLSWDADNTDIDLWVIDPNGEKAFYSHRLTYQGGSMSRDFTGGYGPEEFSLKTAKSGKYLVQAQFYGHRQQTVAGATTLQLTLSTGFGTPRQKDEVVTLRLRGQKEVVTVGEFVVGAP